MENMKREKNNWKKIQHTSNLNYIRQTRNNERGIGQDKSLGFFRNGERHCSSDQEPHSMNLKQYK